MSPLPLVRASVISLGDSGDLITVFNMFLLEIEGGEGAVTPIFSHEGDPP